ncbi:alkyl hydroperoxide reductase AhpD [Deltaproteobacteria bacterium]|nr:alkyl hydroperoxide reductase AhpD [Deltaproteobacteria bacterium]
MESVALLAEVPEFGKDSKLNLQSVLGAGSLTPTQRWGSAITAAATSRNPALLSAIVADGRREAPEGVVQDALAAASLMAMNNVFYRFRHQVGKPDYTERPARLRMNRMVRLAGARVDFELFCLVASAINGCEACVRAHEAACLEGGLTVDQVLEAVRIAAVVSGAALTLEIMPSAALPE